MKRNNHFSDGFSLLELMIALVIATLMFTGIYAMSMQALNIMRITRDESRAIQAAQYEMERLRSHTWMSLLTMNENTTFDVGDNAAMAHLRDAKGYVKRTEITPSGVSNAPLLAVSVTVEWTGFDSELDSKTLTSAITKRGMLK